MFVTVQLPHLPHPDPIMPNTANCLYVMADASTVSSKIQVVLAQLFALLSVASLLLATTVFVNPAIVWVLLALGVIQLVLLAALLCSFACCRVSASSQHEQLPQGQVQFNK